MIGLLVKLAGAVKPRPRLHPFANYKQVGVAEQAQRRELRKWLAARDAAERPKLLDVGGGDGRKVETFLGECADAFDIYVLDIESASRERHINLDITHPCPQELHEQFDVVYSFNAFEHFCDPLTASDNISRMLKGNGLCLVHTVFAWRYHPVPKDYFRFTDDALVYLFSDRNPLECIECGYDIARRRENIVGGYFGDRDVPPLDHFGGFRENWSVYYIGVKK